MISQTLHVFILVFTPPRPDRIGEDLHHGDGLRRQHPR